MPIFTERGIINLDLHGIKHQDVFAEVMDFLYPISKCYAINYYLRKQQ